MVSKIPAAAAAFLMLAAVMGCSTTRHTDPARTATEQLLISAAADRMANDLVVNIRHGTKVFVDSQYFEGLDTKYTIGVIRDKILRSGASMAATRETADTVVEIRSGAQSIDEHSFLIGIPAIEIPVPLSGSFKFPEIALFKRETEHGVSKAAATGYDAKTGAYQITVGPVVRESTRTRWVVMLLISWTTSDIVPEDQKDKADPSN